MDLTPEDLVIAKRLQRDDRITEWIGLGMALLLAACPIIFGYQAIYWLRHAEWLHLTWAHAFTWVGPVTTDWLGIDQILTWIGGLPLAFLPGAAGLTLGVAWFTSADRRDDNDDVRRVRGILSRATSDQKR